VGALPEAERPLHLSVDEALAGLPESIRVRQRNGRRCRASWYSIVVPPHIGIGRGVRVRNRSQGSVIASRLNASAKKANAVAAGLETNCAPLDALHLVSHGRRRR
jgi:hypothetical protein